MLDLSMINNRINKIPSIFKKNLLVKVRGQFVGKQGLNFGFTRQDEIGKIRSVQDAVFVLFQRCVTEVVPALALQLFEEGVRCIQIKARMIVQQFHEALILVRAHVGDVDRYFRIPCQELLELIKPDKIIADGACTDMKEKALSPLRNHFIQREETLVVWKKLLNEKVQLDAEHARMIQYFRCKRQSMGIAGMIGRKAIEVWIFIKNLPVPDIQTFRNSLPMGIIGINDFSHTSLPQVMNAFAIVELMNDFPLITFGEIIPDGVKHPIREKMNMKINDAGG